VEGALGPSADPQRAQSLTAKLQQQQQQQQRSAPCATLLQQQRSAKESLRDLQTRVQGLEEPDLDKQHCASSSQRGVGSLPSLLLQRKEGKEDCPNALDKAGEANPLIETILGGMRALEERVRRLE